MYEGRSLVPSRGVLVMQMVVVNVPVLVENRELRAGLWRVCMLVFLCVAGWLELVGGGE